MPSIPAEEKRWRAEEDARTLAEAERIKVDQKRADAAKIAATRMLAEEAQRTEALRKVAKKTPKTTNRPTRKATSTPKKKVATGYPIFNGIPFPVKR